MSYLTLTFSVLRSVPKTIFFYEIGEKRRCLMSCILRDPALEKCWWNGQARGPIDFPMENNPLTAQIQPLDAVALTAPALTAPGIRYDILRSLLGGLHGVEWELLLPLPAHIGRSLIKPECLKITGLPVQLKADDLLNFRKRQCNR